MARRLRKRADQEYVDFDPFSGDRDTDVRNKTVRLVTTMKPHFCGGVVRPKGHTIPAGTRARYESAIVDGKWESCYVCVPCIEEWFRELGE